ncbi:hypothetical protein Lalb_Chr16g0391861 [Lupinus albus]|uniref:Uncharacterized protein n=1 Tax=Lupinus albus TaxID=3870 RepID=A0A6A4PDW7_LUPAL|nr:hypothetical protein Lalb_Chr16g0391861 [Lupinus albus]
MKSNSPKASSIQQTNQSSSSSLPPSSSSSPPSSPKKYFTQALKNICDISISQVSQLCIKGDAIAIKIPEADYQARL